MGKDGWLIVTGAAGLVAGVMVLIPAYLAHPAKQPVTAARSPPPLPPARAIPIEKKEPRVTYVVPVPALPPPPELSPSSPSAFPKSPPANLIESEKIQKPVEDQRRPDSKSTDSKTDVIAEAAKAHTESEERKPGDICARTGGRRVDTGRSWHCVYAHDYRKRHHNLKRGDKAYHG
jgi:hypothetical protein